MIPLRLTALMTLLLYLLAAGPAGAAEEAAGQAVQQGHEALQAGDTATASAHFRHALATLPADADPGLRGGALLGLATAMLQTGELPAARAAAEEVLGLARVPPPMEAAALQLLVLCAALAADHAGTVTAAASALSAFAGRGIGNPVSEAQIRYLQAAALAALARHAEAIEAQRAALAHAEQAFGEEAPETVQALETLAGYVEQAGEGAEALGLLVRLAELQARAQGPRAPAVALTRARIALLQSAAAPASPAQREGLNAARSEVLSAGFGAGVGDRDAARRALDESIASYGPEHPLTAEAWMALGRVESLFDREAARAAFERALAVHRAAHGEEHLLTAQAVRELARTYAEDPERLGDAAVHARGAELMQQALAVHARVLGDAHPDTLALLGDLYQHHLSEHELAWRYASRGYRALLAYESRVLPYLGAPERLAFRQRFAPLVDNYFYAAWVRMRLLQDRSFEALSGALATDAALTAEGQAAIAAEQRRLKAEAMAPARELLAAWLDRKGQISAAENSLRIAQVRTTDPALAAALAETLAARAAIGELHARLAAAPGDWDTLQGEIAAQRATVARHEARLLAAFPAFRLDREIDLDAVAAALPEDALYVDFARLGTNEYFVFTLDRAGSVALRRLVPELEGEDTIDDRVRALRRLVNRLLDGGLRQRGSERRIRRLAGQLHQDLLRPLGAGLGRYRELIVSPDGLLGLLPFGLLYDADTGKHLVETHRVRHVPSARELLRRVPPPAEPGPSVVVFADPDFDPAGRGALRGCASGGATRAALQSLLGEFGDACVPPLPGTAQEAAAIAGSFGAAVRTHTGSDASEATLAAQRSPGILHLATHGFFLTDPSIVNPLRKSGLLLSGASDAIAGEGEAGIVDGLDLAALDLAGSRLVVLSACETGLGDVQQGEGIAGLNQALIRAGAQGVIMSLWRVPDVQTAELMRRLYAALAAGRAPDAALAEAQRGMLEAGAHPLAWAAFIYSGR